MKKYKVIIFFFILGIKVYSQNLLRNPGFEDPSLDKKTNLDLLSSPLPLCNGWYMVGSVDLFYENSIDPKAGALNKLFGKVEAKEGKVNAGFCLFKWDGYYEQITGSLISPLLKDSIYEISLSLKYACNQSYIKASKLQIKFSNSLAQYPGSVNYWYKEDISNKKITANIEFPIYDLNDSLWRGKVTFYKALGGERFITFGFFYQEGSNLQEKILQYMKAWPQGIKQEWKFLRKNEDNIYFPHNPKYDNKRTIVNEKYAYYFIDEVAVVKVTNSKQIK